MSATGTYNFIYTVNGCSDTATVVRNAKPSAGADQTLACADPVAGTLQTTTTLTGFAPAAGTFTAQAGNPAAATVTNAGAVSGMTVAGTYQFIYDVLGCKDTVSVTVSPCAGCVKPDAGRDQAICAPATTASLTGFAPAGGMWTAQAGNPATATVTNAGAVSGLTANGTYKFIYSVTLGGQTCSDTVSVMRNAKPEVTDAAICAPATTASLTGFTPTGGTWSAQAGNPAAATVTNAGAVSGLTANGTYQFVYTLDGCSDTATVTRNPKPDAGADKSLVCADPVAGTLQTTTTLTGFAPAGGTFTAQVGNPATATVTNAGAVSGMSVAGTYKFIYSTTGGCADTVAVTVQPCAGCVKPNAGADQSICAPATTASLTGFAPAGGTWAAQSGNPATATVTNAGAVSGLTANGTYKFIYTVTLGGQLCSDTVQVTRNAKPVVGEATICAPATTATLTRSPAGGTFAPLAGNPAAASVSAAGAVSGLTANGTYQFVYTLDGCSDTATVTRNAKPDAGADKSLACADPASNTLTTSTTLTGFSPAGGTFTAAAGNPAAATVTNAGAVSGMTIAGTYNFIYTVNGCADTVAVTVQPCAGCVNPNAGLDQTVVCSPEGVAPSTAALTGAPAGGVWSAQTGNPAAATVTNGGSVSGMTAPGTYKFIYSVTSGGQTCTDTVAVIVPTCVVPKGSLGDFVWKDQNNDGIQQIGEPGVASVRVRLLKETTPGVYATVDSTLTNGSGKYGFDSLLTGNYKVRFVKTSFPAGCDLSQLPNVATPGDSLDSDASPTDGLTGIIPINASGTGTAKDNPTIDAALYTPLGSISDFVFVDQNSDGIQTPGEPGIPNVRLRLLRETPPGSNVYVTVDSTLTDSNGRYLFDSLPKGTYRVQVVLNTLPAGLAPTQQGVVTPGDSTNSKIDPTGLTPPIVLDPADTTLRDFPKADAGFLPALLGSIGNYVFCDADGNNRQSPGDKPVVGTNVVLEQQISPGVFAKLDSTLTDAAGKYLFDSLPSGTYRLRFTPPTEKVFITASAPGSDTLNDSNPGSNGVTTAFFLPPGTTDTTRDAGLKCKVIAFDLAAESVTCQNVTIANQDGKLLVTNAPAGARVTFAAGNPLSGAALSFANAVALPGNGVIVSNLPNPGPAGQVYTVRVWTSADCFVDKTVTLLFRDCQCPPPKCIPFTVKLVKRIL